jgi:uncharacterized membrane protein
VEPRLTKDTQDTPEEREMTRLLIPLIVSIVFVAGLSTMMSKTVSTTDIFLVFVGLILLTSSGEYFFKKYIKKEVEI